MYFISVLFIILSILLFKGHTSLINDYHIDEMNEIDKKKYAVAIGYVILFLSIIFAICGTIVLFGKNEKCINISTGILLGGVGISIILFIIIQSEFHKRIQ